MFFLVTVVYMATVYACMLIPAALELYGRNLARGTAAPLAPVSILGK